MKLAEPNWFFFRQHKYIRKPHVALYMYLITWIYSDIPKQSKMFDNKKFYLVHYKKIAEELGWKMCTFYKRIYRLKGDDKSKIPFLSTKFEIEDGEQNKSYIALDEELALQALNSKSKEGKKIIENLKRGRKMEMLFEMPSLDEPIYSVQADSIARLILKRYPQYFRNRIPEVGRTPTKTYVSLCHTITDIYNGQFIDSRKYPLGERFKNSKSFKIDGWKKKLSEVKGDWNKTKQLIFGALKNFELMHEPDRLPYSKLYLQNNLNLWFYDSWGSDPQSQFIQCLFEPEQISKHNSELKADRIFETLPVEARKGGNALFDLNPEISSGVLWECVKKMVEWGKVVSKYEKNFTYWVGKPAEIPGKFAQFLKDNEISVSSGTLDIVRAVDCNGPWCWFVRAGIDNHKMNNYLATCSNASEIAEIYGEK